jgi:NTP pyrophosphatase (non-canonical NTP hydrolase)
MTKKNWTIHEWQTNLHSLYGNANSEGGVPRALNRLFEEVAEIGLILHQADGFNEPLDEVRRKIAREMTDVLAWLFAISSLLDIDVEKALRAVYEQGCPVCRKTACACRNFEKRPHEGSLTHRFMQAEEIRTLIAS